ncbi:hypothetical protein AAZV13_14G151250 [Glycine max]|uniref:uncharacterized protein isoform X1 n=1 Tax=Glycine max TaxID=3847 RepID=UPI001B356385|nr:uncharacterized protein LOC102660644 isoform X1 [Glycine max]
MLRSLSLSDSSTDSNSQFLCFSRRNSFPNTAFTRQPCSLRFSRSFVDSAFMERVAAVSVPFYNGENFPSSEFVWFPKKLTARKRERVEMFFNLYGAIITFDGDVRFSVWISGCLWRESNQTFLVKCFNPYNPCW